MESFIIEALEVELPEGFVHPSLEDIKRVKKQFLDFYTNEIWKNVDLRMWGASVGVRTDTILSDDPHWMITVNGVETHVDHDNPRYVHCLKVMADQGQYTLGHTGEKFYFKRGTYYSFTCREPHGVFVDEELAEDKDEHWCVSIVIDSDEQIPSEIAIPRLIEYGMNTPFEFDSSVNDK